MAAAPVQSLLRASAEQAAESTYVELLLPSAERHMIGRTVDAKFLSDWLGVVEPRSALSKARVASGS
jgi:hypothetical protein